MSFLGRMITYMDLVVKEYCTTKAETSCTITTVSLEQIRSRKTGTPLTTEIVNKNVGLADEQALLGWNYIEYVNGWPFLVF